MPSMIQRFALYIRMNVQSWATRFGGPARIPCASFRCAIIRISGRSNCDDRLTARSKSNHAKIGAVLDKFVRSSRSEEHTSELQSQSNLVCRLLLEKKTYRARRRAPP